MSLYGNFGQEFKCKTSAYQRQQFGIKPRVRLTKDNYNVMEIKPITFEKSGEKIYRDQIHTDNYPILNIYSCTSKATKRDTSSRLTNKRTEPSFFAFFN